MEGERGLAELAQQPLLQAGGGRLPGGREHLDLVQSQLLLKTQAQRLLILSSISKKESNIGFPITDPLSSPKGADELHNDPLVIEELPVEVHHPVHGVAARHVVHKVPAAEVEREPAVIGDLLVNSESDRHAF